MIAVGSFALHTETNEHGDEVLQLRRKSDRLWWFWRDEISELLPALTHFAEHGTLPKEAE